MNPALIVSPHLDDAVLSCGQLLAGRPDCTVVTVFAGTPPDLELLTPYDEKAGFKSSAQAMVRRRAEDTTALAVLKARSMHLDHLDHQYRWPTSVIDEVTKQVSALVKNMNPEILVGPLGLTHPDHRIAREAVLEVAGRYDTQTYLYEELPYRITDPEAVRETLDHIAETHYPPRYEFIGDGPLSKKLQALWHYRSQMRMPEFDNPAVFTVPERFWRVST